MKKLFLLTILLMWFGGLAISQTIVVTGAVTSSTDNSPIIGVSVTVTGTTIGVLTGADGRYSIAVPQDAASLTFTYIGMSRQEIQIEGRSVIDVSMESNVFGLNEVVVTALGISREKKTLGYSATSIKGDNIVNAKFINPLQALHGKVAGLDIASSQTIGGTQNISIRGYSSFGNNQPLIIVDGVPLTNTQNRTGTVTTSQSDFGSGINALNPNDIAEMTILKGSAASALYGSRAAQGVIMITTKSGMNTHGKVNVDYDGSINMQRIGRLPFEQTMFGQGWSMDRALNENGNWGALFDGKERPWGNIVGNEQLMTPNTYKKNRIRDFYDLGIGYNNSVSFAGGAERSTFRVSLSQSNVDGPIPTKADSYNRYTIGINASHKANNKLTVATAFNTSIERNYVAPTGTDNSIYRSLNEIPTGLSIVDFKDINNKFNSLDNYFTPYGLNPYQILDMREAVQNKQKFFGKVQLDWDIANNLKATYRFGGDYETATIKQHFDAVQFSPSSPNYGSLSASQGSYEQRKLDRVQMNHDLILNYNQRLADFSVNALLGLNVNERSLHQLTGRITSIYIPGFYHLSNSLSPATSSETSTLARLWGVFLNADLGYRNYLYLTLTARNDHSSTLPKDNNSYFYPGTMLSFIVSDFLKQRGNSVGIVDFAKVRFAYGRTGKDATPYAVYDRLAASTVMNPSYSNVYVLSFPLGGVNSFTISNAAGNIDLKPELTDELEIGAEINLLDNRLGVDASYYNKLTKGLIAAKPMDPSTGYTSFRQTNIGDVRNSGVELLLTGTPIRTKNFSWDIAYNFTKNYNKVERLEVDETILGGLGSIGMYAVKGKPIGQFKTSTAQTVMLNGVKYTVVNGSGMPQPTPEQVYINKDVNEKYRMGLTNAFTYKGISLSGTLDFRYGGYIYSYTKLYMHWVGSGTETVYNDRNPFIVPNSVLEVGDNQYVENTIPVNPTAWHTFYYNGGFNYTDNFVIDRSFLKLRNLSLSYDMPNELCKKLKLQKIRLSLAAENILLWTPVENQYIDPEVTSFGNNIEAKFGEYAVTPPSQIYVFGLSFSF